MATEAEIIPEQPISLVKTEEESKDLTLEQCDKAVKFLQGDLKKLEGGIIEPTETDECSGKAENMEVAGNKRVETMNSASEGSPEISKGESFLVSPEISKVANETCIITEHSEVSEGSKSIIKEECAVIDNSPKSTEEENAAAMMSIKEASDSHIEKTAKPNDDPSLFVVVKESKEEIAPIEVKENLACSSSFELEDSKNDTVEETSVKGSINTDELDSASPAAETEETNIKEHLAEEPNVQTEQESGKCSSVSEVINVSNGERSSDLGFEMEKTEDKKPLEVSTVLGETASTWKDGEKAIQEEENLAKNLAKPESLKEDTEKGKEETELPSGSQDQIPQVVNVNDEAKNVELALAGLEEKLKSESEPLAEVQGNETLPESSKSQADETSTKAVILSKEVDKEVEKADDSEDIKEHAIEEDYSSVSPECLKEADSKEHIVASHIIEAEERRQDEESGKPVNVHCEHRESEEKIDNIVDESKLCQDKSEIEALKPSLNDTEVNEELVNTSNISSVKTSPETMESDANQERKEVQLEEISSHLAPKIPINDNDVVEKQSLNVEIVDKDETKVIKINEAEKSLTSDADELKKTESSADGDHVSEDKGTEQDAETKQSLTAEEMETSSEYLTRRVETIAEDDISSHTSLQEEKPDKQLQTSVSALPSEDEEHRTAPPVEKIEEDSSDTKATEEECLQAEEQTAPKAVSEEEAIVDQGLPKEEPEELIQTTSSTLPSSEEREHGTEAITTKLDEITGEQTLLANKPEEDITSSTLLSKELEVENISRVEKTEEEEIKEAEIPDKISEVSSDARKPAEICLEREEIQELEGAKKDESAAAAAAQALRVGEPIEQSLTSSSALPSESLEHGTTAMVNEVEEEKEKEVEMLERQRPQEPDAVVDQEIAVAQASITEKLVEIETISTVEKPHEEERKDAENLENEKCEVSSARETEERNELHALPKEEITSAVTSEELEHESKKTEDEKPNKEAIIKDEIREDASDARKMEETSSEKERSIELEAVVEDEVTADHTLTEKKSEEEAQNPTSALPLKEEESERSLQVQEDEALAKDENASSQTLQTEKSEEQIPEPVVALPSDEHKHETSSKVDKTEEEKAKEEETENEDSTGAKTVEGICSEKDDTKVPKAVLERETIASQVVAEESQVHETLREDEISPQSECPRELEGAIEDGAIAAQTLPEEKPADQLHITTPALPSEVQEDETKETKLQEDESPEKIPEQTRDIEEASNVKMETLEKALDNESLTESENAAVEEKPVKARDETGGEENQCEKTNEGTEIILNEVSKEEVMEDKEVTETSYSTPHTEELPKGGSGEDELKDKLIEEKTNEALETKIQTEELVVEAQKASENEIIEKQIIFEDRTVENPAQAPVARIETATGTEEESSTELSQAEGNEKINDSQQPEETTNVASDKQIPREFDPIENTKMSSPIELQDSAAESSQKAEVGSSSKETFQPEEQSPAPSSKMPSEEEPGVKTKADAVEEQELKEVGKEENKELKAVQTPPEEIKDSVSHLDDGCKEDELKDEHTGVLSVETVKHAANNIEKEIVAEDKTVKDPEQASVGMKEATIVKEEVPAKADPIESSTTSSISKEHFPTEKQERALEASEKSEVGDLEPGKAQQICSEAGIDHGEEKRTDNSGVEISQEPASADSGKLSLSDLLQRSTEEKRQVAERAIEETQTECKEEQHVEEAETIKVKEAKTEDEKEEGEEGDEHNKTDSSQDAPVMVEAPRDTDTKPHKKSHNILSGVGSKVKHSISKVKKAITGKSSHSKEPKPVSPKESEK